MCRISIITPTFNSAKTLEITIQSVANQTFDDWEHIIIDGVSTDPTLGIVKKYPHLKWVSESDKGIYDAMNKGIKMAKGEWIYFLGSDNELCSENSLKDIAQHLKKDYDLVYGNVRIIGNVFWAGKNTVYGGEFDINRIVETNICHQAIFYRIGLFKKFGLYDLSFKILADWEFNLRVFAKAKKMYVPNLICNFGAGGVSSECKVGDISRDAKWIKEWFYYCNINRNPFVKYYRNRIDELRRILKKEKASGNYARYYYILFAVKFHSLLQRVSLYAIKCKLKLKI